MGLRAAAATAAAAVSLTVGVAAAGHGPPPTRQHHPGQPEAATATPAHTSSRTQTSSRTPTAAISDWPTTTGSVVQGDALPVRVVVARGIRRVQLQQRTGAERWETVASRPVRAGSARVVIPGSDVGSSRFRLVARHRGEAVATPTRRVRVVASGEERAAAWRKTLYAVGDIGSCRGAAADTAELIPDAGQLLALGDLAYPAGTTSDYRDCYLPHYGRLVATTLPVPGNHEYYGGAEGYFEVFSRGAGTPRRPWYARDSGPWRLLMLNSNCEAVGGCGKGSPQYGWVKRQLRDNPRRCLAAAWHHPVASSGSHGGDRAAAALLGLLVRHGAEFVLNGHDHIYERFARLGAGGTADPDGTRTFVVGTGGADLYDFGPVAPGSQVRFNRDHGVLRLKLEPRSYSWEFLAVNGGFVDSGADTCT